MSLKHRKQSFPVSAENTLSECLKFIEDSLNSLEVKKELYFQTMMLAEEMTVLLLQNAEEGSLLHVHIRKILGDTIVTIDSKGKEIDLLDTDVKNSEILVSDDDEETERAIRSIILNSRKDDFQYSHRNNRNYVRILTGQRRVSMIRQTVIALLIGGVFGLLMRFVFPAAFSDGIMNYVLTPIRTVFMNALQIVIAPIVFFSIATCISQFKDLSELGRIGFKILATYFITTIVAILLSLGISLLLNPGTFGFAIHTNMAEIPSYINQGVDTSIQTTLLNIVPNNFILPFASGDTLQIMFLALMCGIAITSMEKHVTLLRKFFEACNSLFLTITTMISRFIPAVVFCAGALVIYQLGYDSLKEIIVFLFVTAFVIFLMMMIYGLMIYVFGKLNPLTFFKKDKEGMLTSMSLNSSSAAVPVNMRICGEKLGISKKVYSFSIPLGATINMDGTSILLIVSSLFICRAYGIHVPPSSLFSLCLTVMMLSLAAPGVPGAGMVCLAIVLQQLGAPIEGIGLIMGVSPFVEMLSTMSNTTGDIAASLIVSKSENMLEEEVFNNPDL